MDRGERLHRIARRLHVAGDLGARRVGLGERAHEQRDAPSASGIIVRGCSTFAP